MIYFLNGLNPANHRASFYTAKRYVQKLLAGLNSINTLHAIALFAAGISLIAKLHQLVVWRYKA